MWFTIELFVRQQQQNYLTHFVQMGIERKVKLLSFNDDKYVKKDTYQVTTWPGHRELEYDCCYVLQSSTL